MKTSFALNLHDNEGDVYEECVLLFVGQKERTILKFKDMVELKEFAENILGCLIPEIIETRSDELSENDKAELLDD